MSQNVVTYKKPPLLKAKWFISQPTLTAKEKQLAGIFPRLLELTLPINAV